MRKKILVGIVLLVLVVGLMGVYGMPKLSGSTSKGDSKADNSDKTIELNDGFRQEKGNILNFINKNERKKVGEKDVWYVKDKKVIYVDSEGKEHSGSGLDNLKIKNFWHKDVGVDSHGNVYDKSGNLYSDNGLVKISKSEIPGTLDGKVTSVGGQPVIPLKNDQYSIGKGKGSTILDKKTYDSLKSTSPKTFDVATNGILEWKDSKGKKYYLSVSEDKGMREIHSDFDGKTEKTWTTSVGVCKTGCKESDGWEGTSGVLKKGDREIRSSISEDGKIIKIMETDKDGTKVITKTEGKGESHQVSDKKGKLQSWKVWDDKGNLVGSAETEDGKVSQFNQYINGKLVGVCYGSNCNGDSEGDNIIWVTNDKFCKGKKSDCFDEKGNHKGLWSDEDDCAGKECDAIDYKEKDSFLNFEGGFWDIALGKTETQRMIGSVLSTWKPGWEGLSSWWLPDVTKEWRKAASETFDKVLLADYVVPAAVCNYDELHRSKVPGESAVFIEVAPGIVQFVGSIQAEKSKEQTPMLCSPQNKTCPTGLVCEKNFCYKDEDDDKPQFGYFYKITWGVTAPQDEKHTPYKDENGIAIKFNLQFTGENWWLYRGDSGYGNKNTIELKNGDRDGGAITHYSVKEFKEICIHFGAPPRDVSGGEVTSPICADFVESNVGKIEYETSDEGTSTTTTSGTVSYNSNW